VCRKVGDFAEASCAVEIGRETGRVSVVVGALDGAPVSLDALAARIAAAPRPPAALKDEVEDHLRRALPGLDAVAQRMYAATVERAIRRAFGEEAGEP
jgi:carbon-monoxide dehydrogenase medium subunit